MKATLCIALLALVPVSVPLAGSAILFLRGKTVASFLQLVGAGCLAVVVLAHICEALRLFPWMPARGRVRTALPAEITERQKRARPSGRAGRQRIAC